MTTSVDTSYGSWPATTPPFITKYGVVTNPSTSFSTGGVLDPYGAPPSLFINGEQGVWYDPSDFSTMFQDSAGTTPVTAVEQPVGLILDKSGRGNHAIQATVPKRPILKIDGNGKYYLKFDGIDDALYTSSINFTATDKMTVFAGVRKLSTERGIILELNDGTVGSIRTVTLNAGATSTFAGAFAPFANYEINVHTDSGQNPGDYASYLTTNAFAAPVTSVLTGAVDIALKSTASAALRVNSLIPARQSGTFTGTTMSGNLPNAPLFIGSRGSTLLPFNCHLYSLIVRGAQSTDAQIVSAETYVNSKTGAY